MTTEYSMLKSRKFVALIIAAVIFIAIVAGEAYVAATTDATLTDFNDSLEKTMKWFMGVVAFFIGSVAWEDGKRAQAEASTTVAVETTKAASLRPPPMGGI